MHCKNSADNPVIITTIVTEAAFVWPKPPKFIKIGAHNVKILGFKDALAALQQREECMDDDCLVESFEFPLTDRYTRCKLQESCEIVDVNVRANS